MENVSSGGFFAKLFGSSDAQKFDQTKNQLAKNNSLANEPGIKVRVTKEYIKENGTTVKGTKGDDVFIIDADVKKYKIQGNGGNDKLVIKKELPKIDFQKLPNE